MSSTRRPNDATIAVFFKHSFFIFHPLSPLSWGSNSVRISLFNSSISLVERARRKDPIYLWISRITTSLLFTAAILLFYGHYGSIRWLAPRSWGPRHAGKWWHFMRQKCFMFTSSAEIWMASGDPNHGSGILPPPQIRGGKMPMLCLT